jgi:uncharacterized protein (TIGR02996 family)
VNPDAAFLADILAHRDDDAPRLIYADWLDDHGDSERAEFIRLQCTRTRLAADDVRQVPLLLREEELLERHGDAWRAALPPLEGAAWGEFERGFVATVQLQDFGAYRRNQAVWRDAAPIDGLHFVNYLQALEAAQLFCSPMLAPYSRLSVRCSWIDNDLFQAMLESPHLANLTALDLSHSSLGVDKAAKLGAARALSRLRRLNLSHTGLGPAGVEALVNSPQLSGLTDLCLESVGLQAEGAAALAQAPYLPHLVRLELHDNRIGPAGVRALVEEREWTGLTHLGLGNNAIGNAGAEALATWPGLARFAYLNLAANEIDLDGVRALVESLRLPNLARCHVSLPTGHARFFRSGLYPRLLDLFNNQITTPGALVLARSFHLAGLTALELWSTASDTKAIPYLRQHFGPAAVM